MARKKIIINEQELTPTTLGKIDNRKGGIFLFIFIIGLFIAIVIFLPDISIILDKYILGKDDQTTETTNNDSKKTEDNVKEEAKSYAYIYNLSISESDFKVINILVKDNTLSFSITNSLSKTLNLSNYNYFIELFSSDNTLLQRIMIEKISISKDSQKDFSYTLINKNIAFIKLIQIDESEYPVVSFITDDNTKGTLECTLANDTYTYTFDSDKLTNLVYQKTYNKALADYQTMYEKYASLMIKYNDYDGISATINENETSFIYTSKIDYSLVKESILSTYDYQKDATPTVIKFEMETNGFSCH